MERVDGIGGVFFPAADPEALSDWYETHLGIRGPRPTYEEGSWWQSEGPTVFAPFDGSRSSDGWSLNLRVRDLDAMVSQLTAAGIEVTVDPEKYPNGRFAHLVDSEGRRLELRQPDGPDLDRPSRDDA